MKKYLIFLLLLLVSVGASAVTINLTFGTRSGGTNNWYEQEVTDAKAQLQVGDIVVVSYSEVTSSDCQYAICNKDGDKIYTNGADVVDGVTQDYYTCPVGDKDFTFTVDQNLYNAIQSGDLYIQEKGLNVDGKMTICVNRIAEDWSQYKPSNATEIMSTPQYIKDWYNDGYVLKIGSETNYIGKTLRVVCLETADDSYAFLKEKGNGDPAIMSGSDKFSIAGWKYFEVKINSTLNTLLKGNGLRIGGNNYYIAGIYVYDSGSAAPDWEDEASDVIDTYTFSSPLDGSNGWQSQNIDAKFFEFKGNTDAKLANTKNNIIRLVFDGTAGSGAQVSAKDVDGNKNAAAYIRTRLEEKDGNGYGTSNYYYVNYADCGGVDHYDFELSDAITVFNVVNDADNGWKTPIINSADGVKKGMLSTLLQHGMQIGANKVKIKEVQIRKSKASKYISGYAEYYHPLSDKVWRPIALPYNLTRQQVEKAFGQNVMVCDLGDSYVSKRKVTENNISHYEYGISFSFKELSTNNNSTEYLNADYPYIIKIKNTTDEDKKKYNYNESKGGYQGPFIIEDVKADVRDFQSYEFRTGQFSFGRQGTDVSEDEQFIANEPTDQSSKEHEIYEFEQQIKNDVQDAYMIFQSTAPVFDITNTSVGEVEIINSVNLYTPFLWEDGHYYNYYFSDGALWPGNRFDSNRGVKSGLAYVKFPSATYNLFEGNKQITPSNVSLAKFSCSFPEDKTTGIDEISVEPKKPTFFGIYSLSGQLIRKGTSTDGLAKGIYIVNGKKVIINQ